MNKFSNAPQYITCPANGVWWVIDMHNKKSVGIFDSEEEAVVEVRKLNAKGMN